MNPGDDDVFYVAHASERAVHFVPLMTLTPAAAAAARPRQPERLAANVDSDVYRVLTDAMQQTELPMLRNNDARLTGPDVLFTLNRSRVVGHLLNPPVVHTHDHRYTVYIVGTLCFHPQPHAAPTAVAFVAYSQRLNSTLPIPTLGLHILGTAARDTVERMLSNPHYQYNIALDNFATATAEYRRRVLGQFSHRKLDAELSRQAQPIAVPTAGLIRNRRAHRVPVSFLPQLAENVPPPPPPAVAARWWEDPPTRRRRSVEEEASSQHWVDDPRLQQLLLDMLSESAPAAAQPEPEEAPPAAPPQKCVICREQTANTIVPTCCHQVVCSNWPGRLFFW